MSGKAVFTLALACAIAGGGASCAVCADNDDCDVGDFCVEGVCADAPPPRVAVLSPRSPVGETFELALELGFRGGEAVVTLDRAASDPGDPCLPFPPVVRRIAGDSDAYVTRVILFSGLPSLGEAFSVQARVEVNGTIISARHPVVGPPVPPDIGGISLIAPVGADVDVLTAPRTTVVVDAPTPPWAFVEPVGASSAAGPVALPTPLTPLQPDGALWRGTVPAVRGPHILWAEAAVDGVTRRCGHGLLGGPAEVLDTELERLLLTRSLDGDPHHVELSTRVGDAFCEGRTPSELPCRRHVATGEGILGTDGLILGVTDGLVEIAAVPRIVSGPVEVQLRVARGERHVALFGPVILQPALGESWVGGRVVVAGGEVQAVVDALEPPSPGLPW